MAPGSAAAKVEVEVKYAISDRPTFDRLLEMGGLAGFSTGVCATRQVSDYYLDTAGRAILAAGYACRVRKRSGEDALQTLKSVVSTSHRVQRRQELEQPLDATADMTDVNQWSAGPVKTWVQSTIGDRPLKILFRLQQTRTICPLLDGEREVAELSLDAIVFEGGRLTYELEVELLPCGREVELERIASALEEEWELLPSSLSKFERELQVLDAGPVAVKGAKYPTIQPDDPMSEAGRETLRLHFERMLAHEPGTRLGEDIEELHDMRVATRRMRAAIRVFGPYFNRRAIKPHLKGLKRTGRALGPVRDIDVFEEQVQNYLSDHPGQKELLEAFMAAWHRQRNVARERMLAFLGSKAYLGFVGGMGRFVLTPGEGALSIAPNQPSPYQVRHVVPRLIYTRYEAVRAYEPLLASASIELLHALRIDFKRLRYAIEFFVPVLGKEAKGVIRAVKGMQDHLGDLHDADVAVGILQNYLQEETMDQDGPAAYLRNREEERARLVESFPAAWERFNRLEMRQNLALAVAAL